MLTSTLQEFTGKILFDENDDRWSHLLNNNAWENYIFINEADKLCLRELFSNNMYTYNFQRLLDKVNNLVKSIERHKGIKPLDIISNACSGMCLIIAIIHHASEKLSNMEMNQLLCIKNAPESFHATATCPIPSNDPSSSIEKFILMILNLLRIVDDSMTDLQFFAVHICILFVHIGDFQGVDYFQRALQFHAVAEMQQALANPADTFSFSSCLPVQLVRSLLYLSVNAKEEHLHSNSFVNQSTKHKMSMPRGEVILQVIDRLSQRQSHSLIKTNDSPSTANSLLGTIQSIFFDLVTKLPVKGWKEFLTVSSSRMSILRDRLVNFLPVSTLGAQDVNKEKLNGRTVKSFYPQECFGQFLLLLLHHRSGSNSFNPFRQAFSYLADLEMDAAAMDEEQDIEMLNMRSVPTSLSVNYVHVNMRMIVEVITDMLPNPTFVLLLYSFLQMHPTFIETLRQMEISKIIILNLLRGIYRACSLPPVAAQSNAGSGAASPTSPQTRSNSTEQQHNHNNSSDINHLYTLVVCLLIMMQDSMLFPRYAAEVVTMPWYKERSSSSMKLLDAVMVVMLRTMSFAVFRAQDSYLLSNVCAIVMNLIPSCRDLHPYASERIVRTIFLLAKRLVKHRQHENMLQRLPPVGSTNSYDPHPHPHPHQQHKPTESVATTVLPTTTPKFIQRGAHKWQVSYNASDAMSMDHSQHLQLPPGRSSLPSLASASLDNSQHHYHHRPHAFHDTTHSSSSSSSLSSLVDAHASQPATTAGRSMDVDIALLQVALMTLTQFTVAVVKSRMVDNIYFLYALISDHGYLTKYFPAHQKDHNTEYVTSYDAAAAGGGPMPEEETDTDASLLAEQEDSAEWRVLYEDMQSVTAIAEYYLAKFESFASGTPDSSSSSSSNKDKSISGEHYFTAKEAALYLKKHVLKHHQPSSTIASETETASSFPAETTTTTPANMQQQEAEQADVEKYQVLLYRLHRGYVPSSSSSTLMDDYFRARYGYQEADNAAEFFIPYIWSNVISLVGEEK